MCPLRIILLLRFATCIVQIPAPRVYCPTTIMPDNSDEADTNSSARASNYLKDRLGAEPLTALSGIVVVVVVVLNPKIIQAMILQLTAKNTGVQNLIRTNTHIPYCDAALLLSIAQYGG